MTPVVSPQSQALDARNTAIRDVLQSIAASNTAERSEYAQRILAWKADRDEKQGKPGFTVAPIPDPPSSWIAVSAPPDALDLAYPGMPPMIIDQQTGPPVADKYTETANAAGPGAPSGTIVHVGGYLRNGEYACMPDDNMPDGYVTKAPDGKWVKKMVMPTPWGNAAVYTTNV